MCDRSRFDLDRVDTAARDVVDVLLVVGVVLTAEPSAVVNRRTREALATVLRLAADRAEVVCEGLESLQGRVPAAGTTSAGGRP